MTYKDVLTYVDAEATNGPVLNGAAAVAAKFRAHLTALHVEPDVFVPVGPAFPAQLIEWQETSAKERTQAALQAVRAAERATGSTIEWRTERGDPGAVASMHALYADLTVTAMHDGSDKTNDINLVFESVLLSAGRPVLAIPAAMRSPTFGRRILIAWKANRCAGRAVQEALPFLRKAEAVQVLEFRSEAYAPTREVGADIALHLSRHDVAVEVAHDQVADRDIGAAILDGAKAFGADLIVAGAYGHMRTREYMFGGTSVHLMRNATVPLFMAH